MASNGDKVLYFLVGGFVGAAVALLFAPKSGQETRKYIEDRYREGADKVGKKVNEGREYIGSKTREGRDYVSDTARGVGDRLHEVLDKGREVVTRQKDQLSAAVEAGKDAYTKEQKKIEDLQEQEG